jgi:hypothetical protein
LSAIQKGARIVVEFRLPTRTTEDLAVEKAVTIELRVGTASAPFEPENWAAGAKKFRDIPADEAMVNYALPVDEWIGKDVVIGARVFGDNGRTAGWSNFFTLSVVPPLSPPDHLAAQDVREGVRLMWQGSAPKYRVYRRADEEPSPSAMGEADSSPYTDTTTGYDKTYHYAVEGLRTGGDIHAVSERSAEATITPRDTYPPPVPAGVAAVVSTGSIELMWDRGTAPDLAGYRIYRAPGAGPFEKLAEAREAPSYSDRSVEPGKSYRYAVSAFDKIGNESEKSSPVAVTAQ